MTDDWKPSPLIKPILRQKRWFGDGNPTWIECRGKPHERPCQTVATARKIRNWTARNLRRMAKRNPAMQALAERLENCRKRRCGSGACSVCNRAQQRWFVSEAQEYLRPADDGLSIFGLQTLVPDFGLIHAEKLTGAKLRSFRSEFTRRLRELGVPLFLGFIDIVVVRHGGVEFFQLHVHGLGLPFTTKERALGRKLLDSSDTVPRSIRCDFFDGDPAGLAYVGKANYQRREQITKRSPHRADHRDTRLRPLKGPHLRRLLLALDDLGLSDRMVMIGCRRKIIRGELKIADPEPRSRSRASKKRRVT